MLDRLFYMLRSEKNEPADLKEKQIHPCQYYATGTKIKQAQKKIFFTSFILFIFNI